MTSIPTLEDWSVFDYKNAEEDDKENASSAGPMKFVETRYKNLDVAVNVLDKYSVLRKHGFPVPPTTVIKGGETSEEEAFIVATDMRGGKGWKFWGYGSNDTREAERLYQSFLKLDLSEEERSRLLAIINGLMDKASEAGISLYVRNLAFKINTETREIKPVIYARPDLPLITKASALENNSKHKTIFRLFVTGHYSQH